MIVWKSHDDSIAQRTALDYARQEKNSQHEKRRATITQDDSASGNREKPAAGSASNGNGN
jgi:translation initiation factor 4E